MSPDQTRWDKAIARLAKDIEQRMIDGFADDRRPIINGAKDILRERLVPLLEQFDKILFLTGEHVSGATAKAARLEIAKWR